MRNPRHQFVLLGFLAQSLVWDSWVPMLCYSLLWVVCLRVLRGRISISLGGEALVLLFGCLFAFAAGKVFNRSTHFFLGEGLIFLQAVRLIRPLKPREKLTSILIACFHFGVVCTLAPNIRFVLLFLGAVALFPRALESIQLEDFGAEEDAPVKAGWASYAALLGLSVILFFGLPRFFTGAPLFAGAGEPSLLDTVLDPSRGGAQNSDRVLLQIEGEKIGYLRCYGLTEFDGVRWSFEKNAPLRPMRVPTQAEYSRLMRRAVRVKNGMVLGRVLPTDGNVRWLRGNFFTRPVENTSGVIEAGMMWNTANNTYEYFIDPEIYVEGLSGSARRKLTWHPEQSKRLHQWLGNAEAGGTNSLERARAVERFLRRSYAYAIGTPELNRVNPVEDFIFNRSEGHCERFAAAMALFLRMQGVPSRVVIGYVATSHNPFTGWHQVRFKDAHAWTEGYFEDLGWVQFDATPGPPAGESGLGWRQMFEALDFAWYSHIVNFDGFAQKQFFGAIPGKVSEVAAQVKERSDEVGMGIAVVVLTILLIKKPAWLKRRFELGKLTRSVQLAHQYGRMLHLLEKHGYPRSPSQTPKEFLQRLRREQFEHLQEAEFVTESFCRSAYGRREPQKSEIDQVEEMLHGLKRALSGKRN